MKIKTNSTMKNLLILLVAMLAVAALLVAPAVAADNGVDLDLDYFDDDEPVYDDTKKLTVEISLGEGMYADDYSLLYQTVSDGDAISDIVIYADDGYCFDEYNYYYTEYGLYYDFYNDGQTLVISGIPECDIWREITATYKSIQEWTVDISLGEGMYADDYSLLYQTVSDGDTISDIVIYAYDGYCFDEYNYYAEYGLYYDIYDNGQTLIISGTPECDICSTVADATFTEFEWMIEITTGLGMYAENPYLLSQIVSNGDTMMDIIIHADNGYYFDEADYGFAESIMFDISPDGHTLTIWGIPDYDLYIDLPDAREEDIYYSVTVLTNGDFGFADSSISSATHGDIVDLYASAYPDYIFAGWRVLDGDVSWYTDSSFVMPPHDVVITAVFSPIPLPPTPPVPSTPHNISINVIGPGIATASHETATAGTKVSIIINPEPGYELLSITDLVGVYEIERTDSTGSTDADRTNSPDSTTGTGSADSMFWFIMPDADVSMTAVFSEPKITVPTQALPSTLNLRAGWNFVSVAKYLDDSCNTAAELLSSVKTGGVSPLSYHPASGWYTVDRNETIEPLAGYWIYSEEQTSIPLSYSSAINMMPAVSLMAGWNAVGLCAEEPMTAKSAFANLDWLRYLPWNVEQGKWARPIINGGSAVNSEENYLLLGCGGWLYIEEDGVYLGNAA